MEKTIASLEGDKRFPCYLLYGDESYLLKDALDRILDQLIAPADRELNLFVIDGGSENIDTLCESLLMPPLLPGGKVVLVRNTHLFLSKNSMPELIRKIREHLDADIRKAAREFLQFLALAGWSLDDLTDDGWKKIDDDEWQRVCEGGGEDRAKWLPRLIEYCVSKGVQADSQDGDVERLSAVLSGGLPADNHLIITAETVDKRKKLYKTISEIGAVLNFSPERGEQKQKQMVMGTAREMLQRSGKRLTPAAWIALGRKTGFDLRGSMGAIEKVITYAGDKKEIDEDDIEAVIGKTKEDSVFDLTEAMAGGDLKKALFTVGELLELGNHHLMILTMIAREMRFLLHAKLFINSSAISFHPQMDYSRFQKQVVPVLKSLAAAGAKYQGVELALQHPYVIYNVLRHSARFREEDLMGYMGELVDMDVALKSTGRDPRLMLERFLAKVCS